MTFSLCVAAQAIDTAQLPFMFDSSKDISITEGSGHGTLTDWWNTFRVLQAAEVCPLSLMLYCKER